MAEQLNLTNLEDEQEPYILTKNEENIIIENAIKMAKENYQYRMLQLGDRLQNVLLKISEIDWIAEIDSKNLFKTCNSNKIQDNWFKERRKDEIEFVKKRERELKEKYTAKFIFNLMAFTSKKVFDVDLIVNEQTKMLIKVICFFISKDHRFETELGYSFKKGLLIRGVSGLGKTFLIRCVQDNELQPVQVLSMIAIANEIKSNGEYRLSYNPEKIIYLDDVGTEQATINHFGTKINFFKDYLEMYYLNNIFYNNLIISMNNDFDEIEEKYGFRVRSRIKDMFNIIDVVGEDMRGIKLLK